jgi:hypothetical protein
LVTRGEAYRGTFERCCGSPSTDDTRSRDNLAHEPGHDRPEPDRVARWEGEGQVIDAEVGEGPDVRGNVRRAAVHRVERLRAGVELDPRPTGEPRHRPPRGLGGRADDRDPPGQGGRARGGSVIGVGQPARAPECPLVATTEPDRHVDALGGERLEEEVLEAVEPAVERLAAAGPEVPAHIDRLLRVRAALVEALGDADVRELGSIPADAEAGDEATIGERIERGQLLREDDRVAHRDDDHAGPEANRAGAPGDPRQRGDGLVDPAVVLRAGVVDEDVVRRPHVGEAVLLRERYGGDHAVAIRVVAEGGEYEPVVHPLEC